MKRLEQFIKYFLIFIAFYILANVVAFHMVKSNYKSKNVNIDIQYPQVEVTSFKATITNGYLEGMLYNNTNEELVDKYLSLDFYSKNNKLLGTKFIEIKDLLPNESIKFDTKFNFDGVDSVKGMIVNGQDIKGESKFKFFPDDLKLNTTDKFILFFAVLTALPVL